jgi:hypothetical protein
MGVKFPIFKIILVVCIYCITFAKTNSNETYIEFHTPDLCGN